jgi:hypothetical protein
MGAAPGFFDVDDRLRRLSDLGDQLEAYGRVVDFEAFRPDLEKALAYPRFTTLRAGPARPSCPMKFAVVSS